VRRASFPEWKNFPTWNGGILRGAAFMSVEALAVLRITYRVAFVGLRGKDMNSALTKERAAQRMGTVLWGVWRPRLTAGDLPSSDSIASQFRHRR
jgi:hypothetical protein